MAEAIVLICDQCGKPNASSITIRAGARNFVKDLCKEHLQALLKDTRAPRRGRPKVASSSRAATTKATTRKRRGSKKPGARKRVTRKAGSKTVASKKKSRPAAAS